MRNCHPVKQEIESIDIWLIPANSELEYHAVGKKGVTRIEACTKEGQYSDIPYLRVWSGDSCVGEFCQHNILAVNFKQPEKSDV